MAWRFETCFIYIRRYFQALLSACRKFQTSRLLMCFGALARAISHPAPSAGVQAPVPANRAEAPRRQ